MFKGVLIVFLVVISSFFVVGQELETSVSVDAGTTPDSIVWGLDRAIEKIEIAFTLGPADKERKRLEHAYERILEVRKMIEEGKIEQAEKARKKHSEIIKISKEKIAKISADDKSSLEYIAILEDSVELQETEVEDIDISVKIKGSLSDNQKKLLQDFISSLEGNLDDVKIVIKNKEDETLTRIGKRTGVSRIDLVDELGRLREKKIVRAEVFDSYSIIKVGHRFTTRSTEREVLIEEILRKFAVSESDVSSLLKIENSEDNESDADRLRVRIKLHKKDDLSVAEVEIILRKRVDSISEDELKSAVVEFTHLTKDQIMDALVVHEKKDDKNESKRMVKVESKKKGDVIVTRVKIEWNGLKKEIIVHTDNVDLIVERLANLLNVSPDEIRKVIEVYKEESDEKDDVERDIKYIARGKDCELVKYICEERFEPFRDSVGCGCKKISDDSNISKDEFEND